MRSPRATSCTFVKETSFRTWRRSRRSFLTFGSASLMGDGFGIPQGLSLEVETASEWCFVGAARGDIAIIRPVLRDCASASRYAPRLAPSPFFKLRLSAPSTVRRWAKLASPTTHDDHIRKSHPAAPFPTLLVSALTRRLCPLACLYAYRLICPFLPIPFKRSADDLLARSPTKSRITTFKSPVSTARTLA